MSFFTNASKTTVLGGNFISISEQCNAIEILLKNSSTSAAHNSGERLNPPRCLSGTRKTALAELWKWATDGYAAEPVMWLHGPAGAGKSAMAQTFSEMCEGDSVLAASYFVSQENEKKARLEQAIPTIAYQMVLAFPDTRSATLAAVAENPGISFLSFSSQIFALIVNPLLRSGLATHVCSMVVVVDGIDEDARPVVQAEFLQSIFSIYKTTCLPLKFLLSSRPSGNLRNIFKNGSPKGLVGHLCLDASLQPDNDIKQFYHHRFSALRQNHILHQYIPGDWPPEDVIEFMVEKASGQFIFASTAMTYIESSRHRPTERLSIIMGVESPPGVEAPFASLDEVYMQILSSVEDWKSVRIILGILMLETPITPSPSSIESVLSWDAGHVVLSLYDMTSLIRVSGQDDIIQLYHASFIDFLQAPNRSGDFSLNAPMVHADITARCVITINIAHGASHLAAFHILDTFGFHLRRSEPTSTLLDALSMLQLPKLMEGIGTECKSSSCTIVEDLMEYCTQAGEFGARWLRLSERLLAGFDNWFLSQLDADLQMGAAYFMVLSTLGEDCQQATQHIPEAYKGDQVSTMGLLHLICIGCPELVLTLLTDGERAGKHYVSMDIIEEISFDILNGVIYPSAPDTDLKKRICTKVVERSPYSPRITKLLEWVERVFLHPWEVSNRGRDPLFQAIVGYKDRYGQLGL